MLAKFLRAPTTGTQPHQNSQPDSKMILWISCAPSCQSLTWHSSHKRYLEGMCTPQTCSCRLPGGLPAGHRLMPAGAVPPLRHPFQQVGHPHQPQVPCSTRILPCRTVIASNVHKQHMYWGEPCSRHIACRPARASQGSAERRVIGENVTTRWQQQ